MKEILIKAKISAPINGEPRKELPIVLRLLSEKFKNKKGDHIMGTVAIDGNYFQATGTSDTNGLSSIVLGGKNHPSHEIKFQINETKVGGLIVFHNSKNQFVLFGDVIRPNEKQTYAQTSQK